jgi:hypothetical protein
MTTLAFEVLDATSEPHAAVPTIMLRAKVNEADGLSVHALALRCQIRIEPQRRTYSVEEEEGLYELFGETAQWGHSLRPFLWTHVSTTVGKFAGSSEFDLPIECTYDFEVAGAKYLHTLRDEEIPLLLLFSGTSFTRGTAGFVAEPLSWSCEAAFRLPVSVYRATMDHYFPNSAWVRVHRDTFDTLQVYRISRGLTSGDQAIERLLKEAGKEGS